MFWCSCSSDQIKQYHSGLWHQPDRMWCLMFQLFTWLVPLAPLVPWRMPSSLTSWGIIVWSWSFSWSRCRGWRLSSSDGLWGCWECGIWVTSGRHQPSLNRNHTYSRWWSHLGSVCQETQTDSCCSSLQLKDYRKTIMFIWHLCILNRLACYTFYLCRCHWQYDGKVSSSLLPPAYRR